MAAGPKGMTPTRTASRRRPAGQVRRSSRGRPARTTKDRIVQAALKTLKTEGFAGTSARAIAARGGFNQALIFYHFGDLDHLLLAALERTSAERLARYREAVAGRSVSEIVRIAAELHREDLASGHITVLSELIAASLSRPHLRPAILRGMEPWLDFAEEVMSQFLTASGLPRLIPVRTVAMGVVAFFLGANLLSHLDEDGARSNDLFAAAESIGALTSSLLHHPKGDDS